MYGSLFSKGFRGTTEVELLEGLKRELLASRLAASNIVTIKRRKRRGNY
jgi:hypothetical protein